MKPKAYIFDIDGTLADCSHRLHHITGDKKDWDAFYAACKDDKPIEDVCKLCRELGMEYEILFVTGRPQKTLDDTLAWLIKYDLPVLLDCLYMRCDDDRRQDYLLKKTMYLAAIKDEYNVIGVFEDRQQCVDMWRSLGLTCFQVAKGDY